MFKRKTSAKILLIAMTLVLLLSVLTSCGSNSSVGTKDSMEEWKINTEGKVDKDNGTFENNKVTWEDDRGFIDNILFYLGKFINWITKIMPWNSYILALFIFAIVIEIIMLPFSIMQQKNSRKQALLRPKEMAIRKRYAGRNDQATQRKVQEEIQELYQKEQFNPMSGCLPLLIQLPIIMALYSIVINPMKYVIGWGGNFVSFVSTYMKAELGVNVAQNGTIGFISDFKEVIQTKGVDAFEGIKDFASNGEEVYAKIGELAEITEGINLNIGPINMGYIPSFTPSEKILWWLLAIPVLTFVFQFFTMKISRKFTYQPTQNTSNDPQAGCSTKMMDWMMPLMSVWMAFIVPAAVGIYWMFKGVVGTVKQIVISKVMPLPKFTEEDYKAAEREYAGKHPKKVEKSENAGKVRSLHHIDDEDYDEKGNYVPKAPEKDDFIEVTPEETVPESLPENKMTEGATLKDESDRRTRKEKKYKKDLDENKYKKD